MSLENCRVCEYIKSKSHRMVVKCPDCEQLRAEVKRLQTKVEAYEKSRERWKQDYDDLMEMVDDE